MRETLHFVLIVADAQAIGPFRSRSGAEIYAKYHQYRAWRVLLITTPHAATWRNVENDH